MYRAAVAIVVSLIAIMFAALRIRCSSSWHVCSRAPAGVETAKRLRPTMPAVMRPAEASLCRHLQLGRFKPTQHIPKLVLLSNSSRQLSNIPFASSNSPGPMKSTSASTFDKAARLLKAFVQSLLAAALLLATFPYLLSTTWGTRTASTLASRVYPGDVRIERISLGWAQPMAVEGVELHEGAAGDSRRLFAFERMSSAEPLYAVCRGRGLTLTVTKPVLDCSLDDTGEQSRLLTYFQAARLLNLITGPPSSSSSGGGKASTAAALQLQEQQHGCNAEDITTTAAAAPESMQQHSKHGSSSKKGKQHQGPADPSSHPILTTAESLQEAEAEPPPLAAAAAVKLSPLRQRLTQVDAVTHLSAELRLPQVAVFVPDGQLLLPQEVKAAVGSHIHAVAAAGADQVVDLADELEESSSWLQQQQWGQQQQQQDPGGQSSADLTDDNSVGTAAAAVPAPGWPLPPQGVSNRSRAKALPFMLQVTGDHLNGLVRGWRLGPEQYVLQQPAQMNWEFTTELARLTLSQFNPLLEEVVSVKEGGHLLSTYSPTDGQLPATTGQVHVSPMKLQMGQGQLLKQIYRLLDISQNAGIVRRPWSEAPRRVEVWTGPLQVAVEAPGQYKTSRTDMIIGSGSSALHLAVWGSVNTANDTLDMRIGLPAATLAKAGFRNLPSTYVLPIPVTGHMDKPQINWPVAVRKLAVLSAMQLGRDAWQGQNEGQRQQQQQQGPLASVQQGFAGLFGVANRALTNAASSFIGQVDERLQQELQEVPPAAALPWEQQQQQPSSSSRVGKDAPQQSEMQKEAAEVAAQQQQQQQQR